MRTRRINRAAGACLLLAGAVVIAVLGFTGNLPGLGTSVKPAGADTPGAQKLGDVGPGACIPGKSFFGSDGPQKLADWFQGKDARDPHRHDDYAVRYGQWIAQHTSWYEPPANFDGNSPDQVADYFRNQLGAEQITVPLGGLQNHFCDANDGGKIKSVPSGSNVDMFTHPLPVGEWVWFTKGSHHASFKAACGNPLLPPAAAPPANAPPGTPGKPTPGCSNCKPKPICTGSACHPSPPPGCTHNCTTQPPCTNSCNTQPTSPPQTAKVCTKPNGCGPNGGDAPAVAAGVVDKGGQGQVPKNPSANTNNNGIGYDPGSSGAPAGGDNGGGVGGKVSGNTPVQGGSGSNTPAAGNACDGNPAACGPG